MSFDQANSCRQLIDNWLIVYIPSRLWFKHIYGGVLKHLSSLETDWAPSDVYFSVNSVLQVALYHLWPLNVCVVSVSGGFTLFRFVAKPAERRLSGMSSPTKKLQGGHFEQRWWKTQELTIRTSDSFNTNDLNCHSFIPQFSLTD